MNEYRTLVDPTFDMVFKYIFGRDASIPLLIKFLNSLCLRFRNNPIISLELKDPANLKRFADDKLSFVDVKAKTSSGAWVNVELQSKNQQDFVSRSIYYNDLLYTSQIGDSEKYSTLKEAISFNILDFELFPSSSEILNGFVFKNILTNEILEPIKKEIYFLELVKNSSSLQEAKEWKSFFTDHNSLNLEKLAKTNEAIGLALKSLKEFSMNPKMRALYEKEQKKRRDLNGVMDFMKEEGRAEGRVEGKVEGMAQGRVEGKAQGILDSAQRMLNSGMSHEQVSKILSISLEDLKKLN